MRRILWTGLILAIAAVKPSHAIFGIGGHWAPAPTLSVKAEDAAIAGSGASAITLSNGESSSLQGFGVKLWVDALPFVDIEAASNVQFGTYDVSLTTPNSSAFDLEFDLGIPLAPTKPAFVRIHNDISVLYPFLKLPPLVSIAKLYGGAGLTYGLATSVLSPSFAKETLEKAAAEGDFVLGTTSQADVADLLVKAIQDEGLQQGVGFYLQLGAKVKPPIIPIAAYVDAKYQFFGFMPDEVDGPSLTLEVGGALAF
jgi:hypothetical protein